MQRLFLAEIGSLSHFSGQKQVISKKKKTLKVFADFGCAPESKNSTILVQMTACPSQLQLPNPFAEGGCFQFWSKNRPQKHQKRAILHTFQANGGGSSLGRLRCWVDRWQLDLKPKRPFAVSLPRQFGE